MDPDVLALAFDRWMDDYIADPERFEREWQMVLTHTRERLDDRERTYGHAAAATLLRYVDGLRACATNQPTPPGLLTPDP